MLIVVAVIAILVAISIPTVKTALEKSKHAVDDANERAAIGLGNIYYLTEYPKDEATVVAYYEVDANKQGKLKIDTANYGTPTATSDAVANIRKCTNATNATTTDGCKANATTNKKLKVTITKGGAVTVAWAP